MRTFVAIVVRVGCEFLPEWSTIADRRPAVRAEEYGGLHTPAVGLVDTTVHPPESCVLGFLLGVVHDVTIPPGSSVPTGSKAFFQRGIAGDEGGDVGSHMTSAVETEEEDDERMQYEIVAVFFRSISKIVLESHVSVSDETFDSDLQSVVSPATVQFMMVRQVVEVAREICFKWSGAGESTKRDSHMITVVAEGTISVLIEKGFEDRLFVAGDLFGGELLVPHDNREDFGDDGVTSALLTPERNGSAATEAAKRFSGYQDFA